jgi:hypothetical protein
MRYDDTMKEFVRCGVLWLSLVVLGIGVSGCKDEPWSMTPEMAGQDVFGQTPDPAIARTLQADVAMTAAWLLTLTPAAPESADATPVVEPARSVGTPPSARNGACPVPGGFALQDRQGFCMAVPASWVVWNVDGGAVSFLKTTPDQVLALRPDWAESASVCSSMIYISLEESALDHLGVRHRQFSSQEDIQDISPIKAYALGEMGILGFSWSYKTDETGAVFAEMVGIGRLLHISFNGSDCLLEDMLPVLETLRINN